MLAVRLPTNATIVGDGGDCGSNSRQRAADPARVLRPRCRGRKRRPFDLRDDPVAHLGAKAFEFLPFADGAHARPGLSEDLGRPQRPT